MGDPAGIGPEIAIKAFTHKKIYTECAPIVLGDYEPLADAIAFTKSTVTINRIERVSDAKGVYGEVDLIDVRHLPRGGWRYGEVGELTGKAAFHYIKLGIGMAMRGEIHAVVTGPINKESLNLAGLHYPGHTEIFAELTGTKNFAMMLANKGLRVIHVTTHVSIRRACDLITKERVLTVIRLAHGAMRDIGIDDPRIAVAGLNPHSSENGLFGDEEANEIIPAIETARAEGMNVDGPTPPDTVFVKATAGQYDVVVAMYHDQGHIPLKLSGFKMDPQTKTFTAIGGINYTIGLPIIRTSVDHGTAFDRAGEGRANEESLVDAIELAIRLARRKFAEG
jgi:4-hydroxythreonine-4-phosphate dehydrogenase